MAGYRQEQLNELLMCELAQVFRDVKDPRVSDSFVSVTGADVAKDLSVAKVYFSVMNGDPAEVKKGLDSAKGYIRCCLAERLNLRLTPKLVFIHDDSGEKAVRINKILKDIKD